MFINHLLVLVCSRQHLLFLSPHVEQGRLLKGLRELESLRTSFGGAGVGVAGAPATIRAGGIAPVLLGLGVAGAAGLDPMVLAECGEPMCVSQKVLLTLSG